MANAKILHGDIPAEDPSTLLADVSTTLNVLEDLNKRIQLTQGQTLLESGKTLADAIVERDILAQKRFIYQSLVAAASSTGKQPHGNELRWLRTVNVSQLQHQIEQIAKEHQLLDIRIQKAGWTTELLE